MRWSSYSSPVIGRTYDGNSFSPATFLSGMKPTVRNQYIGRANEDAGFGKRAGCGNLHRPISGVSA